MKIIMRTLIIAMMLVFMLVRVGEGRASNCSMCQFYAISEIEGKLYCSDHKTLMELNKSLNAKIKWGEKTKERHVIELKTEQLEQQLAKLKEVLDGIFSYHLSLILELQEDAINLKAEVEELKKIIEESMQRELDRWEWNFKDNKWKSKQ